MLFKPLPRKFYLRNSLSVARDLLGMVLVKKSGKNILAGKIVETEAYMGDNDPGSHAYKKITERNKVMYDKGGLAYIYFIYGYYFCFNVVCGKSGTANAVLIRAMEPIIGLPQMEINRGQIKNKLELSNGPAKLCLAMDIDRKFYGMDITKENEIFISKPGDSEKVETVITKRIGLSKGKELPFRFFIKDNPYVTKHKFNKISF